MEVERFFMKKDRENFPVKSNKKKLIALLFNIRSLELPSNASP